MRFKVNFLFLLIFISSIASCTKKKDLHRQDSKALNIGLRISPKTLNPLKAIDQQSSRSLRLIGQSLVKLKFNSKIVPDLVQSYKIISATQIQFQLSENSVFHNGKPITAMGIKKCLLAHQKNNFSLKKQLSLIKKITIKDVLSFDIHLKEKFTPFLANILSRVIIFDSDFTPKNQDGFSIFNLSGPFQFSKAINNKISFNKFEPYRTFDPDFMQEKIDYSSINLISIKDHNTRLLHLTQNNVDAVINSFSVHQYKSIKSNNNLTVTSFPGSSISYLIFNHKGIFKNPKLRLALSLSLDKSKILKTKLKNIAVSSQQVLPLKSVFHSKSKSFENFSYQPQKAVELIKNLKPEEKKFSITSSNHKEFNSILKAMISQWKKAGFNVTLKPFEWATFYKRINQSQFDLFNLQWTNVKNPYLLYKAFHSSQTPPNFNRGYFSNQQLDTVLVKLIQSSQSNAVQSLVDKAQKIIHDQTAFIPLWSYNTLITHSKILSIHPKHQASSWVPLIYSKKSTL